MKSLRRAKVRAASLAACLTVPLACTYAAYADGADSSGGGVVLPGDDPVAANKVAIKNFVNPDLAVLPDNVNWDGKQQLQTQVETFHKGVKLPNTATPYTVYRMREFHGYNKPTITNADAFGWKLIGAASLSQTGQAYSEGTGESGIINPEGKKNIAWLGKYSPNGESVDRPVDTGTKARDFIGNADQMPADTVFEFVEGEYCRHKTKTWQYVDCASDDANAAIKKNFVDPNKLTALGIWDVLVKATFAEDGSSWMMGTEFTYRPRFNMGVRQELNVTPGQEIVITPSWVSNGNKDGIDQIRTLVYDITNQQGEIDWNRAEERPKALIGVDTNADEPGKQGFVWKVPEGVTRISVSFQQADEKKEHTGLADKKAIAVSGFTGAHATSGSHLAISAADTNKADQQYAGRAFDYTLTVQSDGQVAAAGGQFTAKLPQGVKLASVSVGSGDSQTAGEIKDGVLTAPLPKLEPGEQTTITLHGLVLPTPEAWDLESPMLSYDTFAVRGGYVEAAPDGAKFHINQPYKVTINAIKVPTVDAGTQTDTPTTEDTGTQTDEPSTGDAGTQTDTPTTGDAGTRTDEPSTGDAGTQTDEPSTGDAGTQTDTPSTGDAGTQTDTPSTGDAGTQTDAPSTGDTGKPADVDKTDQPDGSAGSAVGEKPNQTDPATDGKTAESSKTKQVKTARHLPSTGSDAAGLAGLAGVALACGIGLAVAASRKRS
ncbi:LPXTG cell wall anchor domain-containing protein [Actinotignum timonense]